MMVIAFFVITMLLFIWVDILSAESHIKEIRKRLDAIRKEIRKRLRKQRKEKNNVK